MLKHPRALIDSASASPTLKPDSILARLKQFTPQEYAQAGVLTAEVSPLLSTDNLSQS